MKRAALLLLLFTCITNCKTIETTQRKNPEPQSFSQVRSNSTTIIEEPQVDLSFVSVEFRDFVPEVISRDLFLDYNGFVLEFDTLTQHAKWVSYLLCRENLGNGQERSSNFRMEKRLGDHSPRDASYKNSGYDRGHLAPAADMSYSAESMYDSFFLTNASPQVPGFNRGIWKRLEEQIRKFATEKDSIFIATGPILDKDLPTLGNSKICIPEYYYKVILKKDPIHPQGIGFILRNESASGDLSAYAISIDSVEVMTGINFFPLLDAKQEAQAESKFDLKYWFGD
ncbi:DNA/RNA non-specific endonuclease [Belliella kenyensis]|uniref:Endonuclease n=1 Tax=Belliella kenyensis TaxID=1472724 RepID=A0ABV8EIY9_9BACT|nr:DNA/RNA non-specific endonuclease [Belliella kenyensis]MCH7401322.1 DNA/RNA non-specific endonuclease [Belliella kenyensis]MDN3602766.1 DNA/RNA non-specific endonuclease [Belliella kenyensis]